MVTDTKSVSSKKWLTLIVLCEHINSDRGKLKVGGGFIKHS